MTRFVKLGDCCTIVSGATPRTDEDHFWGGDILWATPKDLSALDGPVLTETADRITVAGYESASTQLLPAGAVLVSSRAPIGLVAIAGRALCTNQGFKSLVPGPGVDSTYLFHCMRALAPRLAALGNGATFKEVSKPVVERFEIPLPLDLKEQQRVAQLLDRADVVRRKCRQAVRLTDELLRSSFLERFGDPLVNPKGWKTEILSSVAEITTGNTPPRKDPEHYASTGIEWIKSDNLGSDVVASQASERLSKQGEEIARSVRAGSTLITCIAGSPESIGKCSLLDRRVSFNQQINAVTAKRSDDDAFVYALFRVGKKLVQRLSTEAMKGLVSKGRLESLAVPWPDPKKRADFAKVLNAFIALRQGQQRASNEAEQLFKSLESNLLLAEALA